MRCVDASVSPRQGSSHELCEQRHGAVDDTRHTAGLAVVTRRTFQRDGGCFQPAEYSRGPVGVEAIGDVHPRRTLGVCATDGFACGRCGARGRIHLDGRIVLARACAIGDNACTLQRCHRARKSSKQQQFDVHRRENAGARDAVFCFNEVYVLVLHA